MSITVAVQLGPSSYEVRIGTGLLDELGPAVADLGEVGSVVVIADSNVSQLYGQRALESLRQANLDPVLIEFPAGEEHKNLKTYGRLMDGLFAVEPPIDRNAVIVALGGGVTGDLAGFVAATALRGLRWVQCPTSLLADVDASVGGKTAVDHTAGKNLIGAFHQPRGVLIDTDTLKTLSIEQVRNGLAECVKHGVIRDAGLLDFIEQNAEQIVAVDPQIMTDFIARNVTIKAAVVSADERESGQRAHLNFGHTIGHAIETLVGYDRIGHGEAVSLGMVAACRMAVQRGLLTAGEEERVRALLERLGLAVRRAGLKAPEVWQIMQRDKKARGGRVRMVLPTGLGKVEIFDDVSEESVREALKAIS